MADMPKPEDKPVEIPDASASKKPRTSPGGAPWFLISLIAVLAAVSGIFSYALGKPMPWLLGSGLAIWGILDLWHRRNSLSAWRGSGKTLGNILDLFRGLFLVGLGAVLLLQELEVVQPAGANILLLAGVCFLVVYFVAAYVIELSTRPGDNFPHALLLAAMAAQFGSFFCFTVLFSLNWAAIFCALAFAFIFWAVWRGVLKTSGSVASSVALVTILLGAPFVSFFVGQVFFTEIQPVFQSSLFLPRYYELEKDLDRGARDLAWAPRGNQPGAPGDIPFSDTIAFTAERKGVTELNILLQRESGALALTSPSEPNGGPARWSPDARLLASVGTDPRSRKGRLSVYKWNEADLKNGKSPAAIRQVLKGQDAMPFDAHGQVWSPDSRNLYFAAPASLRLLGGIAIWRATMGKQGVTLARLTKPGSRLHPAVSPDGKKVLYVLEKENDKYFNIGDTKAGLNHRRFHLKDELGRLPAWNIEQTQVLFADKDGKLRMMRANNKSDAMDITPRQPIPFHTWKSDDGKVFTLYNAEYQYPRELWVMNADGSGARMIYIAPCDEILPPTWSADSKKIAFIERTGKNHAVWTMSPDGTWPHRFFAGEEKLRALTWSPDGNKLAWFVERHETKAHELWTADREGNPELSYAGKGALSNISWSPMSQHLAFEERWKFGFLGLQLVRPDLFSALVLDLKEKSVRNLTPAGLFARSPVFSPQGVMIAFTTEQDRWSLLPSEKRPVLLAGARLY